MRETANQERRKALAERIAAAETRLADPGARGRVAGSALEKKPGAAGAAPADSRRRSSRAGGGRGGLGHPRATDEDRCPHRPTSLHRRRVGPATEQLGRSESLGSWPD